MPRVKIKKKEYMASDLSRAIAGKMYKTFRQQDIADKLDITQPAFSARLSKGDFTYQQLLVIFDILNFSDDEILKAMKLKGVRK